MLEFCHQSTHNFNGSWKLDYVYSNSQDYPVYFIENIFAVFYDVLFETKIWRLSCKLAPYQFKALWQKWKSSVNVPKVLHKKSVLGLCMHRAQWLCRLYKSFKYTYVSHSSTYIFQNLYYGPSVGFSFSSEMTFTNSFHEIGWKSRGKSRDTLSSFCE